MNYALWMAKKHQLCALIKKVSDGHGGDDVEWLKSYCREVLAEYPDEKIDQAILCFMDLSEHLKYVPHGTWSSKKCEK